MTTYDFSMKKYVKGVPSRGEGGGGPLLGTAAQIWVFFLK